MFSLTVRAMQTFVIGLAIAIILVAGVVGFYAYQFSPQIINDQPLPFHKPDSRIVRIEGLAVTAEFNYRLPEFISARREQSWWQMHAAVYDKIRNKSSINMEYLDSNGEIAAVHVAVKHLSMQDAVKDLGIIYLAGLIFIWSAVSVFRKHTDISGAVLCFFFLSCGLYLVSSAPAVCRTITLIPAYFNTLINFNHIAGSGLICFVHFTLVFPSPKPFVEKHAKAISRILYGYAAAATLFYLLGITGFNASYPFLIMWVLIVIGVFVHALITEPDPFLKKQIALSFIAPLIVTFFFVLFHILPSVLGTSLMRFTYFSLLTLLLPFSLMFAMDNIKLYRQKLSTERTFFLEKEQMRQDLHDDILGKLANIAVLSQIALGVLDTDSPKAREKLTSIHAYAVDHAAHIRELLSISDESNGGWEAFSGLLRKIFSDMVQSIDLDLDIEIRHKSECPNTTGIPLSIKVCLYHIFKEALQNIVKHAVAGKVSCVLQNGRKEVRLEISDNGIGFDPCLTTSCGYGLDNMRKRAKRLGGTLDILSAPHKGTRVIACLPFARALSTTK